jgi:hypothetical protein
LKPSGYAADHYVALILAGALISVAMFLWDRRRR